MIKKLIILTTATCRPDMHNICFNKKSLCFLDELNIPIKWIINIDKTNICPKSQKETKDNFQRLLQNYDVDYIISDKPNFFNAFKALLFHAEKYYNEYTIFLNYEDDWIINKKFQLKEIIEKYHTINSYISLVFNQFGTLPPCLFGSTIYKIYLNEFKKELFHTDPEKFIRSRLRNITLNGYPINYFLINFEIKSLTNLLSKKDKQISKMIIDGKDFIRTFGNNSFTFNEPRYNNNNKNYLVTNKNMLSPEIINKIYQISNDIIIINYEDFIQLKKKYEDINCFIYVKFEGTHSYITNDIDYNNTYFKDLGRCIGKSPKLAELYNKNIIITSYYFNKPDPQRKKYNRENFDYIKPFYNSIIKLNLNCIIFHDGLSHDFIKKYEINKIKFYKFNHENYKTTSGNDTRFLVYLDYLKTHKNYNKIIISDINGIEFIQDPFLQLTKNNKIYVAQDRSMTKYGKKRDLTHYWFKNYANNVYGSFLIFENIKNEYALCAGFFCSNYNLILEILNHMKYEFNRVNTNQNTNYVIFNNILYNKFIKNIIKGYSSHNGYKEKIIKNKEYIIKIRNGNISGYLSFDN
jgi:hypothetical protein